MDALRVNKQHELQHLWDSCFLCLLEQIWEEGSFLLKLLEEKRQQWNCMCLWLLNSLQLPVALIPPSFPVLELLFVHPFLLPCNFVLPCSASFYHMLLYLLNSQDISLPIGTPPSITCCLSPFLDVSDSFLSIPLSTSLSIASQAFLPLACLLSLLCCGILDSNQEGGVITKTMPKD